MLPFIEKKIFNNTFIREFKQETNVGEFTWHRDQENRIIETVHLTDWLIQLDNQLPIQLIINKQIKIPKGVYHRLIKGTNNLIIKLIKL
jgi:hypothetical protein